MFPADVAVLQECGRPERQDDCCMWAGIRSMQGVGVVTSGSYRVSGGPLADTETSAYLFHIRGPVSFTLLGVWAQSMCF